MINKRESREDRKPEFLSFRRSPFPLSLFNFSAHLTMMVWSLNVFIVIFSLFMSIKIDSYLDSLVSSVPSFVRSFVRSFTRKPIHSFIHSFIPKTLISTEKSSSLLIKYIRKKHDLKVTMPKALGISTSKKVKEEKFQLLFPNLYKTNFYSN